MSKSIYIDTAASLTSHFASCNKVDPRNTSTAYHPQMLNSILFWLYYITVHKLKCYEMVQTSINSPSNCQVCVVAGNDSKGWLRASPMVFPYLRFFFALGSFIGAPHDFLAQFFFFLSNTLLNMQPEGCQLAGREDVSLHGSI